MHHNSKIQTRRNELIYDSLTDLKFDFNSSDFKDRFKEDQLQDGEILQLRYKNEYGEVKSLLCKVVIEESKDPQFTLELTPSDIRKISPVLIPGPITPFLEVVNDTSEYRSIEFNHELFVQHIRSVFQGEIQKIKTLEHKTTELEAKNELLQTKNLDFENRIKKLEETISKLNPINLGNV